MRLPSQYVSTSTCRLQSLQMTSAKLDLRSKLSKLLVQNLHTYNIFYLYSESNMASENKCDAENFRMSLTVVDQIVDVCWYFRQTIAFISYDWDLRNTESSETRSSFGPPSSNDVSVFRLIFWPAMCESATTWSMQWACVCVCVCACSLDDPK